MGDACSMYGGSGKRPLGRPRNIWECDIKVVLNEIVWEGVDCIRMIQDRGCCECGAESSGYIKCGENFSRRTLS
jgi:hypothetical protein